MHGRLCVRDCSLAKSSCFMLLSIIRCVRCECNNHAEICDPDTGKCLCQDNTVGDDCSRCEDGYYGNPTAGTKDDCKPCPCVFGKQCILIGSTVKCTDCPEGHQGIKRSEDEGTGLQETFVVLCQRSQRARFFIGYSDFSHKKC